MADTAKSDGMNPLSESANSRLNRASNVQTAESFLVVRRRWAVMRSNLIGLTEPPEFIKPGDQHIFPGDRHIAPRNLCPFCWSLENFIGDATARFAQCLGCRPVLNMPEGYLSCQALCMKWNRKAFQT